MSLRNILNKVGVIESPCLTPLSMFENDCTYKQSHQEIWNTLYENAKKIERSKEIQRDIFRENVIRKSFLYWLQYIVNIHVTFL
jgi:hypothetical protein